ncbi:MAG: hypothetical protein WBA67_14025 [Jannaschia sp.]
MSTNSNDAVAIVLDVVSAARGVPVSRITGMSCKRPNANARQEVVWLARWLQVCPDRDLGRIMLRAISALHWMHRAVEQKTHRSPEYLAELEAMKATIQRRLRGPDHAPLFETLTDGARHV